MRKFIRSHAADRQLSPMTSNAETARLRKLVEALPSITVTVLGDLVADEFVFGEISRVSREAPVLILKHRERKIVPGGGANAINNLALLTGHIGKEGASPFSITGQCNAMGSRETCGTTGLPGYRKFESAEDRAEMASLWMMN